MKQLLMGDILNLAAELHKEGMSVKEVAQLPVYIGDDDELNGIHTAWYAEVINPNDEDYAGFVELINENGSNIQITGKSILIS